MALTLAVTGVVSLVVAASFLLVERRLAAREHGSEARLAGLGFRVWWLGIAVFLGMEGVLTVAAAFGWHPLDVFVTASVVSVPLLIVSTWGLMLHILYIYTGRDLARPLAVAYVLVALTLLAAVVTRSAREVVVTDWDVEVEGTGDGPLYRLAYALVGIPPIMAAGAYGWLGLRLRASPERRRALLVSASLSAWILSGLAANLAGDAFSRFATLNVLGLGAAIAALLAYVPHERAKAPPAERELALRARVQDLV